MCVAVLALGVLPGCNKMPINGKLDGNWQIMQIELPAEDGTYVATVPELRRYFNISLHVFQMRYVTAGESPGRAESGNLSYDKKEGRFTVDFPYNTDAGGMKWLEPYGVYSNPVTFEILRLDSKNLVVRTPESIITCRRY